MSTQISSLYEIVGGETGVKAVVEVFYQRVLEDPRIAHYFAGIDMENLHKHQQAFVGHILGSPHPYTGRNMAEAHAGLNLSRSDFDAVAGHMVAAFEQFAISQVHIDAIISRIMALEREITHK